MALDKSIMSIFNTAFGDSPEGKAVQARMDAHVSAGLDQALKSGLPATVNWIGIYADMADHFGIDAHLDAVYSKLSAAGYKTNENINDSKIAADKNAMGRYIVGQVMDAVSGADGMEKAPPPASVTVAFAEKYKSMRDKPAVKADVPKR